MELLIACLIHLELLHEPCPEAVVQAHHLLITRRVYHPHPKERSCDVKIAVRKLVAHDEQVICLPVGSVIRPQLAPRRLDLRPLLRCILMKVLPRLPEPLHPCPSPEFLALRGKSVSSALDDDGE